jgi:hypothetical protein
MSVQLNTLPKDFIWTSPQWKHSSGHAHGNIYNVHVSIIKKILTKLKKYILQKSTHGQSYWGICTGASLPTAIIPGLILTVILTLVFTESYKNKE